MKNIIVIFTLIIFLSCHKEDFNERIQNKWILIEIQDIETGVSLDYLDDIYKKTEIEFMDSSKIIFKGICNSKTGSFFIANDSINISLANKGIGCVEEFKVLEEKTINNLSSAHKFDINWNKLFIYSFDNVSIWKREK